MRHRVAGRHLGRDTDHRLSLYRNLVTDLLRYERITTTEAKAKEIRPMAERIITLGKRGDLHARRQALKFVYDPAVVKRVFDDIAPRMADRPGGYCRITKLEPRKGDGARMATIEMIDYVDAPATPRPQRVTAAPVAAPAASRADAEETAPAAAVLEESEAPDVSLTEVEEIETDEATDVDEASAEAEADEVVAAEVEADAADEEADAPEAVAADEAVAEAESPADGAPEGASEEDGEPKES